MIQISYKNKNKDAEMKQYTDEQLCEIWYDIKKILDEGAEILWVFKK